MMAGAWRCNWEAGDEFMSRPDSRLPSAATGRGAVVVDDLGAVEEIDRPHHGSVGVARSRVAGRCVERFGPAVGDHALRVRAADEGSVEQDRVPGSPLGV